MLYHDICSFLMQDDQETLNIFFFAEQGGSGAIRTWPFPWRVL